ncbi:flagellar basal body-associated protein FliL [Rhodobacteraceae bacterium WD3A24]|nr:flagellar basal body-associated protein FliL [Rhodobacteraceae bacterium WD3A24]
MRTVIPILLACLGLGAGAGAGFYFRPAATAAPTQETGPDGEQTEFARLSNQFLVPIVEDGHVAAMVVLSLSVEVEAGHAEAVYGREPRLRDTFLRVMFDHAAAGGFDGDFTRSGRLDTLRHALTEAARRVAGRSVSDVLIVEIMRQDN